jgi:hypothetical protein
MDDALCLRWMHEVLMPYAHKLREQVGATEEDKIMLFVDGLSGQTHKSFIASARTVGVLTHVGPAGTTDLTQVIDRGIAATLKQLIKALLDDWLVSPGNLDRFVKPPGDGGLTASERRVLLTRLAADAWDDLVKRSDTIVACAEQCGALIGLNGAGIEKFKLPRRGGDARLEVDFNAVGENFADRSDDEDAGDDVVDKPKPNVAMSRRRASNDDDDNDNDADEDDVDGDDDVSSDEDVVSEDGAGVDDDDDNDADDDFALIAPRGFVVVYKPDDQSFTFDSTRVGSHVMLRHGARTAPRRAQIVRVAVAKDRETDRNMNYVVRFCDDESTEPVWLRNREYGVDWVFIEVADGDEAPLAQRVAPSAALQPRAAHVTNNDDDDDDGLSEARRQAANASRGARAAARGASKRSERQSQPITINNIFGIVNVNGSGGISAVSAATPCTATCQCVGTSSSSSTAECRCSVCSPACACRAAGECKNDAAKSAAAKRARRK